MLSWRVQLYAAATAITALVEAGMPAAAADANLQKVALARLGNSMVRQRTECM